MEIVKKDNKQLEMMRHSMSHVLAKAVSIVFKDVKFAIGPAVDNGFYYDFDIPQNITPDEFSKIEKEMKNIVAKNEVFKKEILSKERALELFKDCPYKTELINDLPQNEQISIYYLGDDWFDLCRGPHVESTKDLRNFAFKINKVSGAYWRGNEKNKMLQRIYVYGFENKEDLNAYIEQVADALRRDHNKLGRDLELFTTVDIIGQGLPIMLPKGAKMLQILQRFVEDEEEKRGYLLTKTPFMAKSDLYKISGHWQHYRDNMFVLGDEKKDKEVFALRPMTCPFQFQAYLNKSRSYKDLPLRYNETSYLFRNEASGEMHGLVRVRQFTISEGHLACRPDQVEEEFENCLDLARFLLKTLQLDDSVSYRFSQWDPENREKYIGSEEDWNNAQAKMKGILDRLDINYEVGIGEAAFYGPKLDIQIKNVHGKEDTMVTIQLDFELASRFGMVYTDANGEKQFPVVIHRTSIGCYERTLAYLIEKYAGAFPLWLAPVQLKVMNIADSALDYASEVYKKLKFAGFRVEFDDRNEKIGRKIRDAVNEKIPYMLIVGENERDNKQVAVRARGKGDLGAQNLDDLITKLKLDVENKVCK